MHICFVQKFATERLALSGLRILGFNTFCLLISSVAYGQSSVSKAYIEKYSDIAMDEMRLNQVPASITLAQGILESSNGRSKLSTDCNNHFGIKCKKNWTGSFCNADDDAPNECFRGYPSAAESYKDHSLFLKNNKRYAGLFTHTITDYKAWAYGLKQAGYATNPAYPGLLIGLIERFNLSHYDSMVVFGDDFIVQTDATAAILNTNGIESERARDGDTPKSIANRHNMGTWQIYRYNDLKKTDKIDPGEIVYLKPKRRKAEVAEHIYKEGEDMRNLSQLYGIKLRKLYRKNRIKSGMIPADGELLYMQKKRKKSNPINLAHAEVKRTKPRYFVIQNNDGFHIVRQGETLFSIAKGYKVSSSDIMKWSNVTSPSLSIGQKLIVVAPLDKSKKDRLENKQHIVVKGETIYSISRLYNRTTTEIISYNKLGTASLSIGQVILIGKLEGNSTNESNAEEIRVYHTVSSGETLYSISQSKNVTIEELLELNNMKDSALKVGQTIRIK